MQTNKVLLMILDGWGIGKGDKSDVIANSNPENIIKLQKQYPHAQLETSGEQVGLPDGQMGNSEVGHLNIGAGRIVYQDLVRINKEIKNGKIEQNEALTNAFKYAKDLWESLHLPVFCFEYR